jgi:hypothetical protein
LQIPKQTSSHLACTQPPDFVDSRCSFTGSTPAPSSSPTAITRILLDGSATLDEEQPTKDSWPQAFGGPHQSAQFLATSFRGLHPFNGLSIILLADLSLLQGFALLSSQFPCLMFSNTASFLGVYSICMHQTSMFCVCPPPTLFSCCMSFLRISLFYSYVHPSVLSIWRAIC